MYFLKNHQNTQKTRRIHKNVEKSKKHLQKVRKIQTNLAHLEVVSYHKTLRLRCTLTI